MGKHPDLSAAAESIPQSMFSTLYERLQRFEGDVIPLQIGDTHVAPPAAARLGALGFSTGADIDLYAYSSPRGDDSLIHAIVDKVRRRNRMHWVTADNVQITAGCTHALSCAMRAALDPGDELLLLAPYWPLSRGIALSGCVRPVELPFSHRIATSPAPPARADIEAIIEAHVTERTAGIYMCTPNNPDGLVFDIEILRAIAACALRNELWVISDEVYEDYVYDGHEHRSIATLPGMAERTFTAFSFSKSYAQAGLRVGYLVGPSPAMVAVRRMANATVYSVPRAMQRAALCALTTGAAFLSDTRTRYRELRDRAVALCDAPCRRPNGSTYLFLDLSRWVPEGEDSCLGLLEDMAEAGILLAPGLAFGAQFGNWARLCFTAVARDRLEEGIARLNAVLARTPERRAARGDRTPP